MYGDVDSLVDIDAMVKELPANKVVVNRLVVSFYVLQLDCVSHMFRVTSIWISYGVKTSTRT